MLPRFLYVYYFSTNSRMCFFLRKTLLSSFRERSLASSIRQEGDQNEEQKYNWKKLLSCLLYTYINVLLSFFCENTGIRTYLKVPAPSKPHPYKKNLTYSGEWNWQAYMVLSALNIRPLLRHCSPHSYTRRQSIM